MLLNNISDLSAVDELAVIINCGTKEASTLALLSTLRHADMPVLVIDCESKDGSAEHFESLMLTYSFDLLFAPLQHHGMTLDWFFQTVPAEKVLLVDSDLEILDPAIIRFMREFIDEELTFGAGFVNGPSAMADAFNEDGLCIDSNPYYEERPWIPLTMLKVKFIREAISEGQSFGGKVIYNDFMFSRTISKKLAHLRARNRLLHAMNLRLPWFFRKRFYGKYPAIVYCDTGALLHCHLKYERELYFAGLPDRHVARFTFHFGGVTRAAIANDVVLAIEQKRRVLEEAVRRLCEHYGYVLPASN